MSLLFIRAINSTFVSRDDGDEYDRPDDALAAGVKSAVGIVADEIREGKPAAAVEVCIEDEAGAALLRTVVSLSVSSLLVPG